MTVSTEVRDRFAHLNLPEDIWALVPEQGAKYGNPGGDMYDYWLPLVHKMYSLGLSQDELLAWMATNTDPQWTPSGTLPWDSYTPLRSESQTVDVSDVAELIQALDDLNHSHIVKPLNIQLADGTYALSEVLNINGPNTHLITLCGNEANRNATIINQAAGHEAILMNSSMDFSDLKIQCTSSGINGILLYDGVRANLNNVLITGATDRTALYNLGGTIRTVDCSFSNSARGVYVYQGNHRSSGDSYSNNSSQGHYSIVQGRSYMTGSLFSNNGTDVRAHYSSSIRVASAPAGLVTSPALNTVGNANSYISG